MSRIEAEIHRGHYVVPTFVDDAGQSWQRQRRMLGCKRDSALAAVRPFRDAAPRFFVAIDHETLLMHFQSLGVESGPLACDAEQPRQGLGGMPL